jgi:hypothetical protein
LWSGNAANTNDQYYNYSPQGSVAPLERDITEQYQTTSSSMAYHSWPYIAQPSLPVTPDVLCCTNGLVDGAMTQAYIPGFSANQQHTYGWLTTVYNPATQAGATTGTSQVNMCGYVDDILIQKTTPTTNENCLYRKGTIQPESGYNLNERYYTSMWLGDAPVNYDVRMEFMAIWTCANWKTRTEPCVANGISQ